MPSSNDTILPVYKNRGENISPTNTVRLRATFYDQYGNPVDLDSFPTITIISPSGLVVLGPTSAGVSREGVGKYLFEYLVGIDGPLGVWTDVWQGKANGFSLRASFNFVVETTQMPAINTDGYSHLGDDPGFNYSQIAILNINKLLKTLRARLNSDGKSKSLDASGNVTYVDCSIFSVDMLVTFLASALTDFNEIPYFTSFTFEDTPIIDGWHQIIVEGATLQALASKALIERGREFQITDNGVQFTPPTVSEMLNTQYNTLLANYTDRLKYIKNSMRPAPKGLGTLRPLATNPAFMRLRHLRARQII